MSSTSRSILFFLLVAFSATGLASTRIQLEDNVWYQLAHPGDVGQRSVRNVFGDDLPAADYGRSWALFTYSARQQRYVDPGLDGALPQAGGFWLIQATGRSVTLDSTNVPPLSGTRTSGCSSGQGCAPKALSGTSESGGWNLAGNPFEAPVSTEEVRLRTRVENTGCEVACSLDQASERRVVKPELWSYDGEMEAYVNYAGEEVPTWGAFWLSIDQRGDAADPLLLFPDPFCS